MILTRLQNKMESLIKFLVDGLNRISILGNKDFVKWDLVSIIIARSRPNLIFLGSWDHKTISIVTVRDDVWFLNNDWR